MLIENYESYRTGDHQFSIDTIILYSLSGLTGYYLPYLLAPLGANKSYAFSQLSLYLNIHMNAGKALDKLMYNFDFVIIPFLIQVFRENKTVQETSHGALCIFRVFAALCDRLVEKLDGHGIHFCFAACSQVLS